MRAIRSRLGLTMKDFAVKLGVDQGTVSRYESGKVRGSKSVLLLLAQLAEPGPERRAIEIEMSDDPAVRRELLREQFSESAKAVTEQLRRRVADLEHSDPAKAEFLRLALRIAERGRVPLWLLVALRKWDQHGHDPAAAGVFEDVATRLEIDLGILDARPSSRKRENP